jgi:hypothetical protein
MFDNTNFTAAGASEPPKPAKPRTCCEPIISDLVFCYALRGPDDAWHLAIAKKEPFPDAYTLRIWREPARSVMLYRDTFFTWRDQLRDDDMVYRGFAALLGAAIKATTGSRDGWTMLSRPLSVGEVINLDEEGELPHFGGESFSCLL